MIRRTTVLAAGAAGWALLAQDEHARLAHDLAAAWADRGPLASCWSDALAGVRLHDCGWPVWETRPDVNERGRPRDFTEMRVADALAIWRRSIDGCAAHGPLAAWMTAGHFRALLAQWRSRRTADVHDQDLATDFDRSQAARQALWLTRLAETTPPAKVEALARAALQLLQMADAWSLWLCCAERTSPGELRDWTGRPYTFRPLGGGAFEVQPWPWCTRELSLTLPTRSVPARSYRDADELAAERGTPGELAWLLRPAATA